MGLDDVHATAGRKGYVTVADVKAAEVKLQTFRRHVSGVGWTKRSRGLWEPAGRDLAGRELIEAAVELAGEDVLVTGRSALFLAGIVDAAPDRVELLLPASRRLRARTDICLHRSTMYADVRSQHRGNVRTAAIAHAFADAAAHDCVSSLCQDIATALRLRQCRLSDVGLEVARRRRYPGRANLRRAHGLLTGELVHSDGERQGRRLLRGVGLVPHPRPMTVERRGKPIAEIDIPFPELLYGVEVDGPHHLLQDVAAADRARDRLLATEGWTIDRFFWFEVEDRGAWFAAEVKRRHDELVARIRPRPTLTAPPP